MRQPAPSLPGYRHPLDYGYLEGTSASDGAGMDVWLGRSGDRHITGMIVTVDLLKRDAEVKLLIACTAEEAATVLAFQRSESQGAILMRRS